MRILLTGASGFVGQAVIARLGGETDVTIRAAFRSHPAYLPDRIETVAIAGLGPDTDWHAAVRDVDIVVHCAARVHVMQDREPDPLAAFRRTNVAGTLGLARAAAAAGCRRLVFISSIKVNGESTPIGQPFTENAPPAPQDPYGLSKLEAEEALFALGRETGMEVVVIRPPLVYGPGVKANFAAMMRWVARGVPLPFGAIDNRRSLVGVANLADLVARCIAHPAAANQVFLAGDGEDVSTTALLRRVGLALGKPARLLPVPQSLIEGAAKMLGRKALADRLCGSLQVDIGKARQVLGWTPPLSVDEGLRITAAHFLAGVRRPDGPLVHEK